MLVDISTTGLLVRCEQPVESGTVLRVGIDVGQETFRGTVVARRQVPGIGVALEFQSMGLRDRPKLHALLKRVSTHS